jgi:hypothetical protein
MSDSKYSENECVSILTKCGYPVNSMKRTINVQLIAYNKDNGYVLRILRRPIGNRLLGKIDFLVHYKEYRVIYLEP